MTQQEAAEQMGTGRTTIQALYTQARRKLSRFLVEGTPLTIAGGSYQLCSRQVCSQQSGFQKTKFCKETTASGKECNHMKIAVTYENGQVFQHFGHTEQFKVYEVEERRRRRCTDLRRYRRRCQKRTFRSRHPVISGRNRRC